MSNLTIVTRNGQQSVRQYPNSMGLYLVGKDRAAGSVPVPRITESPIENFSQWLDWIDHMLDEAEGRRGK
jgi:hypothetical protein